jgi:hypothetical protein
MPGAYTDMDVEEDDGDEDYEDEDEDEEYMPSFMGRGMGMGIRGMEDTSLKKIKSVRGEEGELTTGTG